MDRHSQISPSKRTIYDLDSLVINQNCPSPMPAPLDLSCHNRRSSPKNSGYDKEQVYDYSSTGVPEVLESVIPTPQQLHYSQYPQDSEHHGLYPYDQEFAYRISSTCSPPAASSDLYSHQDYHQYRVKSPTSPNPYEESLHYHSYQQPYSPTHDNSWSSSEAFESEYSTSGANYHPLTVATSHISHSGFYEQASSQDLYEPVSPYGLLSPTESQHSSYGAYANQLSPSHPAHGMVGASGRDPRHSSSDSGVSPEPSSATVPDNLTRYPKGKSRRQKVFHKNLSDEQIIQRKREINNDSSRRHRQRKSLSMKQLEEEEQKELARQAHLTKTRDMLKQQTELLGSLINKVDLNNR